MVPLPAKQAKQRCQAVGMMRNGARVHCVAWSATGADRAVLAPTAEGFNGNNQHGQR